MAFTDLVNILQSEGVPAAQLDRSRTLLVAVPESVHNEALRHSSMAELADALAGTGCALERFDRLGADGESLAELRSLELISH